MSAYEVRGGAAIRSLLAPAVATLVALAILVSLGIWQLERRAWKNDLLSRISARAFGTPGEIVAEDAWPDWSAAADEFRRVRLAGTLLPDRTVAIHGLAEVRRGQALQGYYLFTPLRRPEGSVVIVNRGFVPTELKNRTLAALEAAPADASIVGLVRAPETRGWFVPENAPQHGEWFVRSLDDIQRSEHLDRMAPFYVDADSTPHPGGWPRGGQTQITLPNNHLQYAFTWFGLAAALVGVFAAFAWRRWAAPSIGRASDAGGSPGEQPAAE